MPWTDWQTPDPQPVSVADFVRFDAGVHVAPKLAPLPGAPGVGLPGSHARYWGRQIAGRVTAVGELITHFGYKLFDTGPPDAGRISACWHSAKNGFTVTPEGFYSLPGLIRNEPTGYFTRLREVDTDGDLATDSTTYQTEVMHQPYFHHDYTDILAYVPTKPNEFNSHRLLKQNIDFFLSPETGTYIQYHPDDGPAVLLSNGYIRHGTRTGVAGYGIFGSTQQNHTVNVYKDLSIPFTTLPGWKVPGTLGSPDYTYSVLTESGILPHDWSALKDGNHLSGRFLSVCTEGEWPGFTYDWPSVQETWDVEYIGIAINGAFLNIQHPRFRYWTDVIVEELDPPPLRMRQRDDDVAPVEGSGVIPSPRLQQGTIDQPGDRDRMKSMQRSRRIKYGPNSYL